MIRAFWEDSLTKSPIWGDQPADNSRDEICPELADIKMISKYPRRYSECLSQKSSAWWFGLVDSVQALGGKVALEPNLTKKDSQHRNTKHYETNYPLTESVPWRHKTWNGGGQESFKPSQDALSSFSSWSLKAMSSLPSVEKNVSTCHVDKKYKKKQHVQQTWMSAMWWFTIIDTVDSTFCCSVPNWLKSSLLCEKTKIFQPPLLEGSLISFGRHLWSQKFLSLKTSNCPWIGRPKRPKRKRSSYSNHHSSGCNVRYRKGTLFCIFDECGYPSKNHVKPKLLTPSVSQTHVWYPSIRTHVFCLLLECPRNLVNGS